MKVQIVVRVVLKTKTQECTREDTVVSVEGVAKETSPVLR